VVHLYQKVNMALSLHKISAKLQTKNEDLPFETVLKCKSSSCLSFFKAHQNRNWGLIVWIGHKNALSLINTLDTVYNFCISFIPLWLSAMLNQSSCETFVTSNLALFQILFHLPFLRFHHVYMKKTPILKVHAKKRVFINTTE